jgi:hypothetical protein
MRRSTAPSKRQDRSRYDDRTRLEDLTRVAKVICDIDGPSERHVYELEQLLRDAGWSNPPEYEGPSRVRWLTEVLADRAKDHGDIARLLCRVCDPLEYYGGMPIAEAFRAELNQILEAERLAVSYVGGRPVLGELTDDPDQPMFSAPEGLENRLSALLTDPRMVMLREELHGPGPELPQLHSPAAAIGARLPAGRGHRRALLGPVHAVLNDLEEHHT